MESQRKEREGRREEREGSGGKETGREEGGRRDREEGMRRGEKKAKLLAVCKCKTSKHRKFSSVHHGSSHRLLL